MSSNAAGVEAFWVEYQGKHVRLVRAGESFDEPNDDPLNLTEETVLSVERMMREAPFGPVFPGPTALWFALRALQFPGYGLFYANQLARGDSELELVYVAIPPRRLNRYLALERRPDGSLKVVDDFIAAKSPEITGVHRSGDLLVYTTASADVVVPTRQ